MSRFARQVARRKAARELHPASAQTTQADNEKPLRHRQLGVQTNFLTSHYGRELRRRELVRREERRAEYLDLLRGRVRDQEKRDREAA